MRLIVGLGNPEKDYRGTRHNVGFETINKLAFDFNIAINSAKHRAHSGNGIIGGSKVMLAKPQTFMNLSGESISEIMAYYKIPPEDIIVVYDDIDIPVGDVRVREKGSAGSHNGMKNILYQLETDEFIRVRIGIGEKPPGWDLADYVLSRFKKTEEEAIITGIESAADAVKIIITDGAKAAMNKCNKKKNEA